MKKILFLIFLAASGLAMPATVQAGDKRQNVKPAQEESGQQVNINSEAVKKYALYEADIYEEPVKTYTDEELYLLAHVLAGECQSCPDNEQLYVGSVVLNRKAHPDFPDTIEAVVFQKGQYACINDGNYNREPTDRNWSNAKWLLENGSVLPANVIWQSGCRQGKGVYIRTKWHYYCY